MFKSGHHVSRFQNFPSEFTYFFNLQKFKCEISLHPKTIIDIAIIRYSSNELKEKTSTPNPGIRVHVAIFQHDIRNQRTRIDL